MQARGQPLTGWEQRRQDMGYRNRSVAAKDLDDFMKVIFEGLEARGVMNNTYIVWSGRNVLIYAESTCWHMMAHDGCLLVLTVLPQGIMDIISASTSSCLASRNPTILVRGTCNPC